MTTPDLPLETGIGIPAFPSALRREEPTPPSFEAPEAVVTKWDADEESLRTPPHAVKPRPVPDRPELTDPALYFNRELSWLDFNWRVLHQARDIRTPLLERTRFLAITQSNLDEFVQKRVGGLKWQLQAEVRERSPDGRTPREQLDLIRRGILEMQEAMSRTWRHHLVPELCHEGVRPVSWDELEGAERARLGKWFREQVYPILTPLAVDPGHPFPFISNQSLSLAIVLQSAQADTFQFARVKVPVSRRRWIPVGETGRFIAMEELVARHVHELFKGMDVRHVHAFRLTRSADLRRDEEEVEDLLEMISDELKERRFAPVVRMEVDAAMPDFVVELLRDEFELEWEDVVHVQGPMDFTGMTELDLPSRTDLRFPPFEPLPPASLHGDDADRSIFSILSDGDVLVHHPYDDFSTSVQRFVEEAADDPDVLAIKLTIYRTSRESPIIKALVRAAEGGKQVAVLVEVMARFDEAANIEWGQMLERAGVHVTYGLVGLKTHAKVALVVREEGGRIQTYSHVATGNYHAQTARLYTDIGLLTADDEIGLDLVRLFHYLTGHAPEQQYRRLIVAPRDLRRELVALVDREIEHEREGRGGRIILKMNAIDDVGMIRKLYEASRAGVEIDLIVRGHTRLRPGLPGVSERIRLLSIVGRFLEHDRIFYFGNGGDERVFTGSADWRRRNLEDRVEVVVEIRDAAHRNRLVSILEDALDDNRLAWDLHPDGRYRQRRPPKGEPVRSYHEILMRAARTRGPLASTASSA
ncbi:MAG: polyphosphate kinase 1 [Longimicrobiales bacterium]|nr:polyphosphate kinase 1 [Longimicrobiales bacterium]